MSSVKQRKSWWMFALLCVTTVVSGVAQEPWSPQEITQPQQAAERLQAASTNKPIVLYVGFPVLYRAAHIPDAILAGPASQPEGLAKLKAALSALPRNRAILLYCGCCPFVRCPNVKPAYEALKGLGFSHIEVLQLNQNFHTDWEAKGYPVQKSS